MRDYGLHQLSDDEFEWLVGMLCTRVLGTGTVVFSPGPDGGRDGKFTGTAANCPSSTSPWDGCFIIQAKWTSNPTASCSDAGFWETRSSVIELEIPRIKALRLLGEVDNYLLFTNRKLGGRQEPALTEKIRNGTGVTNVALIGKETITLQLDLHPDIVRACHLDRFRGPLRFSPEDLRSIITAFHGNLDIIPGDESGRYRFEYLELEEKNKLNQLSERYFQYIRDNSEAYFAKIDAFLKNPINAQLAEYYYDIADEFNSKLTIRRDQFGAFDEVFELLYDEILDRVPDIRPRKLINVFLHFMYRHCDIGQK